VAPLPRIRSTGFSGRACMDWKSVLRKAGVAGTATPGAGGTPALRTPTTAIVVGVGRGIAGRDARRMHGRDVRVTGEIQGAPCESHGIPTNP